MKRFAFFKKRLLRYKNSRACVLTNVFICRIFVNKFLF